MRYLAMMEKPSVAHSINPANGEVLETHALLGYEAATFLLARASRAYDHWRSLPMDRRGDRMLALAALLETDRDRLARLITLEMGKVLPEALAEIDKCAGQCRYYAEHAARLLAPTPLPSEAHSSYILYQPLGIILGVMPWNFPLWQVFRYAIPLLMAGNVTVLKHASNVLGCAKAIEALFAEAGFEPGVFTVLPISPADIPQVIRYPGLWGVSFTGGPRAGAAVAAAAGAALKKTVMELGGSDALVVLNDADIPAAAAAALQSRMANAGQVCIAAKRLIVTDRIHDELVQTLLQGMRELRQGDGLKPGITTGPLARPDVVADLDKQVTASLAKGAALQMGGQFSGNHYQPSLLTEVAPHMPVFKEETFGPVAAVVRVADEREAIAQANASAFGLGASVWTRDVERGTRLAAALEAGSVYINAVVRSDYRFPLGGIRLSGYGRELGEAGIREFTNIKTVFHQV